MAKNFKFDLSENQEKKRKWDRQTNEVFNMKKNPVYTDVGIFGGKLDHEGNDLAYIAYVNEYGLDVPKRPVIRYGLDKNKKEIKSDITQLFTEMLFNNLPAMKAISILGDKVTGYMRRNIDKKRFITNARYTREKKGFNKPMYEHGDLYDAIDHKEGRE